MGEKKTRVRNGLSISSSSILHHQSRILDYVACFFTWRLECLALARCHADPEPEPEPESEPEPKPEPESEPELEPEPSIQ